MAAICRNLSRPFLAVDGVVGRTDGSEAPIENQTVRNLGDGPPYLEIGRNMKGKLSHDANYCLEKSMVE